jgi:uncharacterized protein (DUF2267 family)
MTHHQDPFEHAERSAHKWLAAVAAELDTTDRQFAYRALRAWLHLVRDRLTVPAVAHFSAQLPELLRGVLFEGWVPSRVPQRCTPAEFLDWFAAATDLDVPGARTVAAGVTGALRELFSAGQLDHALSQLPRPLRAALYAPGAEPVAARAAHESLLAGEDMR